jgi:hypothetical protein
LTAVTVIVVVADTAADAPLAARVAVMTLVPVATAVAKPAVAPEATMVAVAGVAEAQVTWLVRFCVVLLENVPVAVNCWVNPAAILGNAGVTAIDVNVAAVTVTVAVPTTVPLVAVMALLPAARPDTNPVPDTVAAAGVADAQVTVPERSLLVLSEYVPVATNC